MAYQCALGKSYWFNPLTSSVPFGFGSGFTTVDFNGISWSGGSSWTWQTAFATVNASYASSIKITFTITALSPSSGIGLYGGAGFGNQFANLLANAAGTITLNLPGQSVTTPAIVGPTYPMVCVFEWVGTGPWAFQLYVNGVAIGASQSVATFNALTFQEIEIAGYGAGGQIINFQVESAGGGTACVGFAPDAWPEVPARYSEDPATCSLGKNTSYFVEEFDEETLSENWVLVEGTYFSINDYVSQPLTPTADLRLALDWDGKILDWDAGDTLSFKLAGRVDGLNLTLGSTYDPFGIKLTTPDLLNWIQIKLRRDPTNPLVYQVRLSESFGVERTGATPAFSAYPLEAELRVDVTKTSFAYYVDGVLVESVNWPTSIGLDYLLPRVFVGRDGTHRGYLYYLYISGTPGFLDLCDGVPSLKVVQYRNEMVSFLPFGAAWVNLTRKFWMFLESFAVEAARIHDSALTLLRESNPGDSTLGLLLPRWEETLLLPEEMPTGTETEAERQRVVNAKLLTPGGQSRAYFQELAANLGLSIEITERGYWVPARVGVARVGRARTSGPANVFYWNIRFVIDNFDGPTVYWAYDGDEDFATYPGYYAARVGVFSSFISFQGGPLAPTWPVLGFVDPITVTFTARCIYSGAGNQAFFQTAWADSEIFDGDYVFFNFTYIASSASYCFDFFGTQNGAPYSEFIDTGIRLIPDATFDFLVRILPTGFEVSIPSLGASYSESGFVFPDLKYLDFNLQRTSATLQGMLSSLGISSDAQVAKFKAIVERTKPAHTVVTYT